MSIPLIALIGPNTSACTTEIYDFGVELGQSLAQEGFGIVCGGLGGFMEAVCRGANESGDGLTIGLLPGDDVATANPWVRVAIPTGLGIARNLLVVRSGEMVVAVGGGAGTLSELAFAWQLGKPVVCCTAFGGWSEILAGSEIDNRRKGLMHPATSLSEVLKKIKAIRNEGSP